MPVTYPSSVALQVFDDVSPVRLNRTVDAGDTWEFVGSLDHYPVEATADDQVFYAVGPRGGSDKLQRTANRGTSWSAVGVAIPLPPDDNRPNYCRTRAGTHLVVCNSGSNMIEVCRSTDEGATWSQQVVHGEADFLAIRPYSFRQARGSNTVLGMMTNQRLVRSDDDGVTWYDGYQFSVAGYTAMGLHFTRGGSILVWLGANTGAGVKVHRSADDGLTFSEVLSDLTVDWFDGNDPFRTQFAQYEAGVYQGRITLCAFYRSDDDGQTWQATGAAANRRGGGQVQDSAHHGQSRSVDGGATWAPATSSTFVNYQVVSPYAGSVSVPAGQVGGAAYSLVEGAGRPDRPSRARPARPGRARPGPNKPAPIRIPDRRIT